MASQTGGKQKAESRDAASQPFQANGCIEAARVLEMPPPRAIGEPLFHLFLSGGYQTGRLHTHPRHALDLRGASDTH